jgi:hypothetical protein
MAGLDLQLIKETYLEKEQGFDLNTPSKFCLSVEMGNNYFSYAVFDPVLRFLKLVGKVVFEFNDKKDPYSSLFSELLLKTDVIKPGFHSVYITWNQPGATLVPLAFYSESNKEKLLSFNHSLSQNNKIITDEVRANGIKVIYAIPDPIKSFFDTYLSNHRLKHIATTLLENQLLLNSKPNQNIVLINVNNSNFNLLMTNKDGLRFFNTFDFQNTEDVIYYTLFAMEQNKFDVTQDRVVLAGEIEAGSGAHQLMARYISKLEFAVTDKTVVRGNGLTHLPHHFYFNVINRFVCG